MEVVGKNELASDYFLGVDSFELKPTFAVPADYKPERKVANFKLLKDRWSNPIGLKATRKDEMDKIILNPERKKIRVDELETDGLNFAITETNKGVLEACALCNGKLLKRNNQILLTTNAQAKVAAQWLTNRLDATISLDELSELKIYLPSWSRAEIKLDGQVLGPGKYTYESKMDCSS